MQRHFSLGPAPVLCLALCLAACSSADVSGKKSEPILPRKILVVGIMGDESDRGTDAFDDVMAKELHDCGITEGSVYKDMGQPGVTLSMDDQAFEDRVQRRINHFQPDAMLEVTVLSNVSHPHSIVNSEKVRANYAINLTDRATQRVIWSGKGDANGSNSRAEFASKIMRRLKKSGVLGSCD